MRPPCIFVCMAMDDSRGNTAVDGEECAAWLVPVEIVGLPFDMGKYCCCSPILPSHDVVEVILDLWEAHVTVVFYYAGRCASGGMKSIGKILCIDEVILKSYSIDIEMIMAESVLIDWRHSVPISSVVIGCVQILRAKRRIARHLPIFIRNHYYLRESSP